MTPESIRHLVPKPQSIAKVEKLFGEASYREYFRVFCHSTPSSYVLMKMPPGAQSVSEEISNDSSAIQELSFVNVQKYLVSQALPVPKLISQDLEQGYLLLEDLGDRNLEQLLTNCNEAMTLLFYQQAIDLLLKLQKAGHDHPDPSCRAFHRSFDAKLLTWELHHFLEYGIEDRFQTQVPDSDKKLIEDYFNKIVTHLLKAPQALTHRDFQSRNLMFYGYEFYLIDFQDALMGPYVYDLVALLRDSYVTLSDTHLEKLMTYFQQARQERGLPVEAMEHFQKTFFFMTLQRKLKDTGRFQFIHTVKGNSKFLSHVPNSLSQVKHAFTQLPELMGLQEILAKYVPELQ